MKLFKAAFLAVRRLCKLLIFKALALPDREAPQDPQVPPAQRALLGQQAPRALHLQLPVPQGLLVLQVPRARPDLPALPAPPAQQEIQVQLAQLDMDRLVLPALQARKVLLALQALLAQQVLQGQQV